MSIFKMVNIKSTSIASLKEKIAYLTAPSKFYGSTKPLAGTHGCIFDASDPVKIFNEMYTVKKLLHKTRGRQYVECVVSPGETDEHHTDDEFFELAKEISETLFPDYQTMYVVHKDSKFRHIHILVNSVSPLTSRKYSMSRSDLSTMKQRANDILMRRGFSICLMGPSLENDKNQSEEATSE